MKKIILFIMGYVCISSSLYAQQGLRNIISGNVFSITNDDPLVGATVFLKKENTSAVTDSAGHFSIKITKVPDTLIISLIGYQRKEKYIISPSISPLKIRLAKSNTQLQAITVSTGYQKMPKARVTGSFDFINNKLLNRSVGTNILDRIENLSPGILFN
ncbi:MAG TPA: carboxypeptidase-like regulatory domain-containing protein, partial [Chitinophagaceae bacterium]|nr:carboxypeptidase-like regulatory domain-containing protein [Chitinophagaceae bacterium]